MSGNILILIGNFQGRARSTAPTEVLSLLGRAWERVTSMIKLILGEV